MPARRIMSRNTQTFAVFCLVLLTSTSLSQEQTKDDQAKASSEQQLDVMRKRIESLKAIRSNGQEYEFSKHPLLRYSDAAHGISDATLWSIGETGRPHGIIALEIYQGSSVQYEFTATSEHPKVVQGNGWRWEPEAIDFTWFEVSEQVPPEKEKAARRSQMSQLACEFKGTGLFRGQVYDLKPLPEAIHWYEDGPKGVIDGGVFVLAYGRNAEVLIFVEAQSEEKGQPRWAVGFSRLGSAKFDVKFAEKEFWSAPANYGDAKGAYFFFMERLTERERAVFGVTEDDLWPYPLNRDPTRSTPLAPTGIPLGCW